MNISGSSRSNHREITFLYYNILKSLFYYKYEFPKLEYVHVTRQFQYVHVTRTNSK